MCMIVSALAGIAAGALSLAAGLGIIVALLAYSATASVALLLLAIATVPREPRPDAAKPQGWALDPGERVAQST